MTKQISFLEIVGLNINENSISIYKQIYQLIQKAILDGRLRAGYRLPSSRELAKYLNISRNTVTISFEQLITEGYIYSKTGAGTYVSEFLPESFNQVLEAKEKISENNSRINNLSKRGNLILNTKVRPDYISDGKIPFKHGLPDLENFPFDLWSKFYSKSLKTIPTSNLGYGNPAGYQPLRKAVADYLRISRGVKCETNQIIIVNGSQQAIDLAARVLLDYGDNVLIEDPCYLGAKAVLHSSGLNLIPVPVDNEGITINQNVESFKDTKLAYVTPSHQFPLGVVMSLSRRLQLLEWAKNNNSWIIEDDYDSEFRYQGYPLPSLQGLDNNNRVINVGSFSKVMFPALRLGYMVVPPELTDAFISVKALSDRGSPLIEQAAIAEFLNSGHFARHIRKMRVLYNQRQNILVKEINKRLGDIIKIKTSDSGMHIIGWLDNSINDRELSNYLDRKGILLSALSNYVINKESNLNEGLIFGYTAFNENEIKNAVRETEVFIREYLKK